MTNNPAPDSTESPKRTPAPNPTPPAIDPKDHPGVPVDELARQGPIKGRCVRWIVKFERYCLKGPIRGGTVCVKHGGAAGHVRRAANERLAVARVEAAVAKLAVPVPGDPSEILAAVLADSNGEWLAFVAHLVELVEQGVGIDDERMQTTLATKGKAREAVARLAKTCLDVGLERRRVEIAEEHGVLLLRVLRSAALVAGVDLDVPAVALHVANEFRQLSAPVDADGEEL